jgi:DNA polymerase
MPWDETDVREAWTYKAFKKGQWVTVDAYGGLLTENVVQALARDMLVDSLEKLEKTDYPVILTVHDEDVCDVPTQRADASILQQVMEDRPQWAIYMDVPVAAETWTGDRYQK